jgi:hypothetical protein
MAETHVISALRAKRAEISGYIHDLEKKVKTRRARLAHIDATIKIFSPEIDPEAIPPRRTYRRSNYFKKGEFARLSVPNLPPISPEPRTPTRKVFMAPDAWVGTRDVTSEKFHLRVYTHIFFI